MGNPQKLGNFVNALFQDASNNVGIGGSPSGTYKFEVTGTAKVSSTLLLGGALTGTSATLAVSVNNSITGLDLKNNAGSGYGNSINFYESTTKFGSIQVESGAASTSEMSFKTSVGGTLATRLFISSAGNVGIGTIIPVTKLDVSGTIRSIAQTDPTSGTGLELFYRSADPACYVQSYDRTNSAYVDLKIAAGRILFYYANPSSIECARFSGLGYFKATNTGTYLNISGQYHELNQSANDSILEMTNRGTTPYGMTIRYANAAPNNTGSEFIYCVDSSNVKFYIYSTGSVYNRSGTYGTITSDIRLKENIIEATSKLNDLMKLRVVNFNHIDDIDKKKNIGFIAQEFKEVFPSLVYEKDTREYDEDGNVTKGLEDSLGLNVGMEFAILVKAIQELNQQNQDLKSRLDKAGL